MSDFKAKMHQAIPDGARQQTPLGSLQRSPDSLPGIKLTYV